MNSYQSFETERLFISPTGLEHAPFILELLNTPKWLQFIGDRNIHDLDAAQNYISDRIVPQFTRLGFSNYTLIRKIDIISIGSCGLYDREGVEGIDIGFALLPAFEKQGYAFEAADKMLKVAIEVFHLPQVSAITMKENISSQRLLERLGLHYVRTIKLPGAHYEILLYQYFR